MGRHTRRRRQYRSQEKNSSGGFLKKFFYFVIFVGIIAIGAFLYAKNWYASAINDPASDETEIVAFSIPEGENFNSTLTRLEDEGIIQSKLAAQLYFQIESKNPDVKFGDYQIDKNKSFLDILAIFESGTYNPGIVVTIKEGMRYEEIATELASSLASTGFSVTEFENIVNSPDQTNFSTEIQNFLDTYKPAGNPLRGFLYPDTYEFSTDTTTTEVIEKMLANFISKVNENIELSSITATQSNITSLYDALILASIVEAESSLWDDWADISGVFHNRLTDNFFLNSDATINFATGKNDPGVLFEDLQIDSPYNTYKNVGLPPTPINNPRIDALIAAINPNSTTAYYFLHTDDGQTIYANTLDEHNYNVAVFRGNI